MRQICGCDKEMPAFFVATKRVKAELRMVVLWKVLVLYSCTRAEVSLSIYRVQVALRCLPC